MPNNTLYARLSETSPHGGYVLDSTAPSGPQIGVTNSFSAADNAIGTGSVTFNSSILPAQTIPAGTWTCGFGVSVTNFSHSGGGNIPGRYNIQADVYLINGSTGAVKATIAGQGVGGGFAIILENSATPGEITVWGTQTGNSAAVAAGDYLRLLFAIYDQSSGNPVGTYGSVQGDVSWYTDGTIMPTTNGAAGTSVNSFLTGPVVLDAPLYPHLFSAPPVDSVPLASALYISPSFPTYLLDLNAPTGPQQSLTHAYYAEDNQLGSGGVNFVSAPLAAQTVPAGNWLLGLAYAVSGATWGGHPQNAGNYDLRGNLYLINGSNGQVRTSLGTTYTSQYNGSTSGETTSFGNNTSVPSFTVLNGDYLLYTFVISDSSSLSPNIGTVSGNLTWYTDGTTPITASGMSTANAESAVQGPVLLFAPPGTTLYLHTSVSALTDEINTTLLPAAFQHAMDLSAPQGPQQSQALSFSQSQRAGTPGVVGTSYYELFASPHLATQSIPTGNWAVGLALSRASSVSATATANTGLVSFLADLILVNSAGSYINTLAQFQFNSTTNFSETTLYGVINVTGFSVSAGDFFILAIYIENNSGTTNPGDYGAAESATFNVYTDGTIFPTTNDVPFSNSESFVQAPVQLQFVNPIPVTMAFGGGGILQVTGAAVNPNVTLAIGGGILNVQAQVTKPFFLGPVWE